jgi:hypothetical protein
METPALPGWLETLLREHAGTHGPLYGGFLADHLPMALLARYELGGDEADLRAYADVYAERLSPPEPHPHAPVASFDARLGDRAAYGAYLSFFARALHDEGRVAVLRAYLPRLVSAWVRDAYHPIIRLAYGVRFACDVEIAAGLAYLASVGPDPELAAQAPRVARAGELPRPRDVPGVIFAQKYQAVLESGALPAAAGALPDNVGGIAELALDAFNTTHDFLALHLVTGTHAFAICLPYLGDDALALLRTGIAAGYLAIGAPTFERGAPLRPAQIDDEHDTKLAFSCADLAGRFDSPVFREATRVYRPATGAPSPASPR